MARSDGRIEQGQKVRGAISARAWNRAQQAADVVLGAGTGSAGNGSGVSALPGLRTSIGQRGWFGQVMAITSVNSQSLLPSPSLPAAMTSLSQMSAREKQLPVVSLLYGASVFTAGDAEAAIAICCGNNEDVWTVSGFAVTRVRVLNYNHRYASAGRVNTGRSEDDNFFGCLSSAFWGPAKIIGYFASSLPEAPAAPGFINTSLSFAAPTTLTYPNSQARWALVRF
ncbi:MAG: hypothetical protein EBR82_43310 [Caulobacteraceae bacterium]|nr:hypothetical protein [Caulobacteraceae bacterium]